MAKQVTFKMEVDGKQREFIFDKWSPSKVYKMMPILGKVLAVPLSMVMSAGLGSMLSKQDFDSDALGEAIPSALMFLFTKMEEDDIMDLFKLITEGVYMDRVHDVSVNLDKIFEDDAPAIMELVAEVLKQNFAPFIKKNTFTKLMGAMIPLTQATEQLYPQS